MPQAGLARFNVPNHTPGSGSFGLRTGKVTGYNHEDHTIDVILDDDSPLTHVGLMETWAGTDYGDKWQPQFLAFDPSTALHDADDGSGNPTNKRDTYAVISFVQGFDGMPLCIGFFFPPVSQMMIGLQHLRRHVGDTFTAVGLNGTHYLAFNKDGSSISFNNGDPEPPDVFLTDYDKLSVPTGGLHSITLLLAGGSKVHLDGLTGAVEIHSSFDMTILSEQDMGITARAGLNIAGNPLTLSGLQGIYF